MGNLITRSTHHKVTEKIQKDSLISELTKRIRSLVSNGYYLAYSDEQNVSCDIIAMPKAAAIIEGHETHTRTAEVTLDVERLGGLNKDQMAGLKESEVSIPLTQAVIYGWYDNEMGNYVNMLGELTLAVSEG